MTGIKKELGRMRGITIVGIVFIILGVVVLLLQFITMTTHVEGVHIGPFHTSGDAETTFPVSPYIGGLVLAGGIAMFIIGHRKRK